MLPREGYWIITGHEEAIPGLVYLEIKCSACGFTHSLRIPDDYCPKCGTHNHGRYGPTKIEYFKSLERLRRGGK